VVNRTPRRGFRAGKHTRQMGLTHLGEELAPVIPALRRVPDACPYCGNPCLHYHEGDHEVTCITCGWEALMAPPRTANGPAWR